MRLPSTDYKTPVRSLGQQNPYGAVAVGNAWGQAALAAGGVSGTIFNIARKYHNRNNDLQEDNFSVEFAKAEDAMHDEYDSQAYFDSATVAESVDPDEVGPTFNPAVEKHPAHEHRAKLYRNKRKEFIEGYLENIDDPELRKDMSSQYELLIAKGYVSDLLKSNDEQQTFGHNYIRNESMSLLKQGKTKEAISLVSDSVFYRDEEKVVFEEFAMNYRERGDIDELIRSADTIEDAAGLEAALVKYQNVRVGEKLPEGAKRETRLSEPEVAATVQRLKSAIFQLEMKDKNGTKAQIAKYTFDSKEAIKAFKNGDPRLQEGDFIERAIQDVTATGDYNLQRTFFKELALYGKRVKMGPMDPRNREAWIKYELGKDWAKEDKNGIVPHAGVRSNSLTSLIEYSKKLSKDYEKDPWLYGETHKIAKDVPLNYGGTVDEYTESLKKRIRQKRLLEASQNSRASIFTPAMKEAHERYFDALPDADQKLLFLGAMYSSDPANMEYEISKMSENGFKSEYVAAGRLVHYGKHKAAKQIIHGSEMRSDDTYDYILKDADMKKVDVEISKNIGHLWGNDPQLRTSVKDAIVSHYYASTLDDRPTKDNAAKVDMGRLKESIKAVVGDTTTVYGREMPSPPGLDPDGGLERFVQGFSPKYIKDMGGIHSHTDVNASNRIHSGDGLILDIYRGNYFFYDTKDRKYFSKKRFKADDPWVPFTFSYDPSITKEYAEQTKEHLTIQQANERVVADKFYKDLGIDKYGYGYVEPNDPEVAKAAEAAKGNKKLDKLKRQRKALDDRGPGKYYPNSGITEEDLDF